MQKNGKWNLFNLDGEALLGRKGFQKNGKLSTYGGEIDNIHIKEFFYPPLLTPAPPLTLKDNIHFYAPAAAPAPAPASAPASAPANLYL